MANKYRRGGAVKVATLQSYIAAVITTGPINKVNRTPIDLPLLCHLLYNKLLVSQFRVRHYPALLRADYEDFLGKEGKLKRARLVHF